jgi:hypothetical protein
VLVLKALPAPPVLLVLPALKALLVPLAPKALLVLLAPKALLVWRAKAKQLTSLVQNAMMIRILSLANKMLGQQKLTVMALLFLRSIPAIPVQAVTQGTRSAK